MLPRFATSIIVANFQFIFQSEHEFDVRASNNEADSSRIAAKESLVKTLKDCKNRLHFEYLGDLLLSPLFPTAKVCQVRGFTRTNLRG